MMKIKLNSAERTKLDWNKHLKNIDNFNLADFSSAVCH